MKKYRALTYDKNGKKMAANKKLVVPISVAR